MRYRDGRPPASGRSSDSNGSGVTTSALPRSDRPDNDWWSMPVHSSSEYFLAWRVSPETKGTPLTNIFYRVAETDLAKLICDGMNATEIADIFVSQIDDTVDSVTRERVRNNVAYLAALLGRPASDLSEKQRGLVGLHRKAAALEAQIRRRAQDARENADTMDVNPKRRGRLPKDEATSKQVSMLAKIRDHPSLKDDPAELANIVNVSESTVRRWLEEEQQKYFRSAAASAQASEE